MVVTQTRSPIRSSVGLKAVMAVTGIILVSFLIAHMLGNLKIFTGAASFEHYAHWLREIGAPLLPGTWFLWIMRIGLLVAVLGHIWAATTLAVRARAARPVRYAHRKKVRGSYAARTMRWGGVIILLFVIYHLLDLTTGTLNPVGDPSRPYANVVADFAPERWYVTLFYTLAIVTLGFHLRHGLFSALRSLGQQSPRGERRARAVALGFSVALCAGYLAVPFAVLTGLVS
ncbi:succinate dehydrogenase / fumarate reductase cytochrome b subunit [Micromonospora peucetia]|uniref:Succinate dehydrogenase / fumarate reductase cytochrome b subunit n=1 Tax=Micromonospora peucetia TaxID=47871 RepID=A0A1C6W6Y7_9ACTN|nr:succinate dehydrogenase / fumarate reductase cytochrome b subunit [Micromonospora peucetia]